MRPVGIPQGVVYSSELRDLGAESRGSGHSAYPGPRLVPLQADAAAVQRLGDALDRALFAARRLPEA